MLTPRNHALVHPPSFIEFDMSIEGFACLFIPSMANVSFNASQLGVNSGANTNISTNSTAERLFPPMNGFTFLT